MRNFWLSTDQFKKYTQSFPKCNTVKDVLYENHPIFSKIVGSKVLVIGGGPTTDTALWDYHKYDMLISCNHFFLHPTLKNIGVDLASVSPEMKPFSQEFSNYCNNHDTVFFFGNEWWDHASNREKEIRKNNADFVNVRFRYQSKLGAGARMLILACTLEAKSIDFVGIDGYPPGLQQGQDSRHSFEKGKLTQTHYSYELLDQQYKYLSEYLQTFDIPLKNLGHGHKYNILTKYLL